LIIHPHRPVPAPAIIPTLVSAGRVNRDFRAAILSDLIQRGDAIWLDPKFQRSALVLWRSVPEWGDVIYSWALDTGLKDSVVTLEELSSGEDVRGTELEGMHREVLVRGLKVLESKGRAKMFTSGAGDEEGVKFF
jgi:ESCRT-II complex subunit VPS25